MSARLDEDRVAGVAEVLDEAIRTLLLERLTAGQLDERGPESADFGEDLGDRQSSFLPRMRGPSRTRRNGARSP